HAAVAFVGERERGRFVAGYEPNRQPEASEPAAEHADVVRSATRNRRRADLQRAQRAATMNRTAARTRCAAVNPVEREVPDERERRHGRGIYCARPSLRSLRART